MRSLLYLLALVVIAAPGCAQTIEAVNEESSRQVQFRLEQGVECEVNSSNRSVIVRGKLALIDSTSFRLKLGDGYYTTILIDELVRMRHRRYTRQHLAGAGIGSSVLGGSRVSSPSLASVPLVAVSALAGLGIALTSEKASFRRRDPSIYHGWMFRALP